MAIGVIARKVNRSKAVHDKIVEVYNDFPTTSNVLDEYTWSNAHLMQRCHATNRSIDPLKDRKLVTGIHIYSHNHGRLLLQKNVHMYLVFLEPLNISPKIHYKIINTRT